MADEPKTYRLTVVGIDAPSMATVFKDEGGATIVKQFHSEQPPHELVTPFAIGEVVEAWHEPRERPAGWLRRVDDYTRVSKPYRNHEGRQVRTITVGLKGLLRDRPPGGVHGAVMYVRGKLARAREINQPRVSAAALRRRDRANRIADLSVAEAESIRKNEPYDRADYPTTKLARNISRELSKKLSKDEKLAGELGTRRVSARQVHEAVRAKNIK